MGGVAFGSPVTSSNTNSAFLEKNADDATVGKIALNNTDPTNSGPFVVNIQGESNGLNTFLGRVSGAGPGSLPTWTNNDVGTTLDSVKARADVLTQRFNGSAGHIHDGTNGQGPKIMYVNLAGTQLRGYLTQGTLLTGVTGGTTDVSTQLSSATPSTTTLIEGIVVNTPVNVVQLLDTNDNNFLDGSGNKVYARITNSGGVGGTWTLTYYSLVLGVETPYSFTGSNTVNWYYQQLYSESDRPVYSDQIVMVSDLLAGIVADASPSVRGVVNITTQSFGGLKTFVNGIVIEGELDIPKTDVASPGTSTLTYAPFIRVTGSGTIVIQGITAGSDGKCIIIHNSSTVPLTITNQDSGASAGDRFLLPMATDITLDQDTSVEFIYDESALRWVVKSGSASGGSGGGGSGGVNFVGMDSSWQQTNTNDVNAENSIGNWIVYQDTPGVAPVNMSGTVVDGTPITISRTTTSGEVLNGSASFKVVKPAANKQGEGVSVVGYVPDGYTTGQVLVSIPFKVLSGSLVQGDLKFYLYDVVNGSVITPFNNDVVGTQGVLTALLSVSTNTDQIRVGFHFASTSTSALTFSFDDVFVGPAQAALGSAMSDWTPYDLVIHGDVSDPTYGTTTANNAYWRRVGDSVEIMFVLVWTSAGTAGSTYYKFPLPPGLSIDPAKLTFTSPVSGYQTQVGSSSFAQQTAFGIGNVIVFDANNLAMSSDLYVNGGSAVAANAVIGSGLFSLAGTSGEYTFFAKVPIAGWSSNVTMAQSSSFNISSFLVNGSRITGTPPTQLGQYRSYLRDAGAATFSESGGAPTNPPSITDGIRIDQVSAFASGDPSGFPSRYDIFVGKNKNVKVMWFQSPGKTGFLDVTQSNYTTAYNIGVAMSYDPTTGIMTLAPNVSHSSTNNLLGFDPDAQTYSNTGYFDIVVSENALGVGFESLRSEVRLRNPNGFGSTNTNVPRFLTVDKNVGQDILYTDDPALGANFEIMSDGVYTVNLNYGQTGAVGEELSCAIVKNGTLSELTANPFSWDSADKLDASSSYVSSGNVVPKASWTGFLGAGEIIYPNTEAVAGSTGACQMSICKVAN